MNDQRKWTQEAELQIKHSHADMSSDWSNVSLFCYLSIVTNNGVWKAFTSEVLINGFCCWYAVKQSKIIIEGPSTFLEIISWIQGFSHSAGV